MSESVKNKAEVKKNVMKILFSQKEMSIMRYCDEFASTEKSCDSSLVSTHNIIIVDS